MNRRSLLRGLLALPLAPLVAKLLPKAPTLPIVESIAERHYKFIGMDEAISGSDQTSIWLVGWDKCRVYTGGDVVMQRMADDLESKFFYEGRSVWSAPPAYPQLSVQEKIRRAVRGSVGGRA